MRLPIMKIKDFSYSLEPINKEEAQARLEALFDLLFDKVVELRKNRLKYGNLQKKGAGGYTRVSIVRNQI